MNAAYTDYYNCNDLQIEQTNKLLLFQFFLYFCTCLEHAIFYIILSVERNVDNSVHII